MERIKIRYIDDDMDTNISKYLVENYVSPRYLKEYAEIPFSSDKGYENLINDVNIKDANIILIDSKLFENDRAATGKFTGEEFKMILKKLFPFIEVIVITQNEQEQEYGTVQKFRGGSAESPLDYYASRLKPALDSAVNSIYIYRNIASKLKENDGLDKVLIERIIGSLDGLGEYDELTTKDIDELISSFKELQRDLDEK